MSLRTNGNRKINAIPNSRPPYIVRNSESPVPGSSSNPTLFEVMAGEKLHHSDKPMYKSPTSARNVFANFLNSLQYLRWNVGQLKRIVHDDVFVDSNGG